MNKLFSGVDMLAKGIYSSIRGKIAAAKHKPKTLTYLREKGGSLELDLFLPDINKSGPFPVLIWFHGGAWVLGSRRDIEKIIIDQINRGFALASVSYTLAETKDGKKTHWPSQCHEANAAIRFLRANAKELNLDPNIFITCGMSAGGHLASMVAVTTDSKVHQGTIREHTEISTEVSGVIAFYAPTDFESVPRDFDGLIDYYSADSPVAKLLGGPLDDRQEISNLCSIYKNVKHGSPAFLLLHGDEDPVVPVSQSELLEKKLLELGVPVTLRKEQGLTHCDYRFNTGENAAAIENFLDELLRKDSQNPTASLLTC